VQGDDEITKLGISEGKVILEKGRNQMRKQKRAKNTGGKDQSFNLRSFEMSDGMKNAKRQNSEPSLGEDYARGEGKRKGTIQGWF